MKPRDFLPGFVSVVIPNRDGAATLGPCIEAALASGYKDFEVIVVDDASGDDSVEIIAGYPCVLVRLDRHRGTSAARNAGALRARGEILFFTDADCILGPETLAIAAREHSRHGPDSVVGGTYTPVPADRDFFSAFQSVLINYSETRSGANPDYVAAHAMVIGAALFHRSGGFAEDFQPIIEDVEFSHRLRRLGARLVMAPTLQVRHIFNFSLTRSLRNAVVKARYWTLYSLRNGDLLADSGAASRQLKASVAVIFLSLLLALSVPLTGSGTALAPILPMLLVSLFFSRQLLAHFFDAGGGGFAVAAALHYATLYPLAVGIGALAGAAHALVPGRPGPRRG